MKTVISVASVLACALSLNAQISTTLNPLADGSTEIKIRNDSAIGLTAFTLVANVFSVNQGVRSVADRPTVEAAFDTAIAPATESLPPNQERTLRVVAWPGVGTCSSSVTTMDAASALRLADQIRRLPGAAPSKSKGDAEVSCEIGKPVTAGIFADGSTTSDTGLLVQLMLRRSNMLLAVETTFDTLSDAGRRNIPRDQLIAQFKKMADSLRRWYLPPQQRIGLDLYQSIIGKLINLPETRNDAPFPPSEFVEQESATLRSQRVTLSESQPSLANTFKVTENSK